MPINQLYHTWKMRIMELRPGQRITQVRSFVWMVIGIYLSRSVCMSKVACKIPGEAKLTSVTRRLSRMLDNSAIRVREWYEPIAWQWLEAQLRNIGEIRLIVDGTKIGFGHQLLIVCISYRKRSIPIAWTWVKYVRGHSTARKHLALLAYVRTLLPKGAAVFLVGDTEFGSVEILRQLDTWRWFYVLRQKTSTHVWLNEQDGWQDFGSFIQKPGQSVWLGQVCLAESQIYPVNLLAHWEIGEKEPWCLATNLSNRQMTLNYYARRMWIEIVFTQMTKMNVFARRAARDHISDLDFSVFYNHPVNKQFYQFTFLFKSSILQANANASAEILDRSGQANELLFPVHLIVKLLLQIFQALALAIQVSSSPLVFRQRDNAIQISFGEPLQLGLKSNLSKAQVFAPGL
jgi:hypothetical protein